MAEFDQACRDAVAADIVAAAVSTPLAVELVTMDDGTIKAVRARLPGSKPPPPPTAPPPGKEKLAAVFPGPPEASSASGSKQGVAVPEGRVCSTCAKGGLLQSELLLMEQPDWCGQLWHTCQACSGSRYQPLGESGEAVALAAKLFKKAANHSWLVRKLACTGKLKRTSEFRTADQFVQQLYPGMACQKRRMLALHRLQVCVAAWAAQFLLADAEFKSAADQLTARYYQELRAAAADPGHSASVEALNCSAQEADMLTHVGEHMSVSYGCKHCGFYGRNDNWVQSTAGGQYKCPTCGLQYFPFKDGRRWQKIVVITDPTTGGRSIFPAKWPESAEDGYVRGLMAAHQEKLMREGGLDYRTLSAELSQNCAALSTFLGQFSQGGAGFSHHAWTGAAEWNLKGDKWGPSQYTHLKEHGFWGSTYLVQPGEPIFSEWEPLVALMTKVVCGAKGSVCKL